MKRYYIELLMEPLVDVERLDVILSCSRQPDFTGHKRVCWDVIFAESGSIKSCDKRPQGWEHSTVVQHTLQPTSLHHAYLRPCRHWDLAYCFCYHILVYCRCASKCEGAKALNQRWACGPMTHRSNCSKGQNLAVYLTSRWIRKILETVCLQHLRRSRASSYQSQRVALAAKPTITVKTTKIHPMSLITRCSLG